MTDEFTLLLERYDDPVRGECPAGFDYAAAKKRAAAFATDLRRQVGEKRVSELDVRIEDASFHSELSFPGEYGYLRFSNFGDMIALTPDHELPPNIVEAIKNLAQTHGYTLMPTARLDADYTGRHPGVKGIGSWWIRYFDYL